MRKTHVSITYKIHETGALQGNTISDGLKTVFDFQSTATKPAEAHTQYSSPRMGWLTPSLLRRSVTWKSLHACLGRCRFATH